MDFKQAVQVVLDEGYAISDGRRRLEYDGEDPPGIRWWMVYTPSNTASLDKHEFNDLDEAIEFFVRG